MMHDLGSAAGVSAGNSVAFGVNQDGSVIVGGANFSTTSGGPTRITGTPSAGRPSNLALRILAER